MKIGEWRLRSTIQKARRDCRSRAPSGRRRDRPLIYHTLRLSAFTAAGDDLIEQGQLERLLEHEANESGADTRRCPPHFSYGSPLARLASGGLPKPGERPSIGRFAQLLEGTLPNLADSLARHTHQRTDLLERHRLAAFVQPIVEEENLSLIHISEPTRQAEISYAVFCLKKK